jgi:uncharacterized Zn finger protein (UPF0148 family)
MTGMLCSGTGGPPRREHLKVVCPVCGRTWNHATLERVPRHFIQTTQAA